MDNFFPSFSIVGKADAHINQLVIKLRNSEFIDLIGVY